MFLSEIIDVCSENHAKSIYMPPVGKMHKQFYKYMMVHIATAVMCNSTGRWVRNRSLMPVKASIFSKKKVRFYSEVI
jgi:hypothetical protein